MDMQVVLLQELLRHMEWADAKVWQSVLSTPAAETDSTIRERLLHIHAVQQAFLHIWREQPLPAFPDKSKFVDLVALASWARQGHAEVAAHSNKMQLDGVEKTAMLPFAAFFEAHFGKSDAKITVGQTILQVTSHSSHHRGQVNTRLRELGIEPPTIDFIVWLWLGKPTADWPALTDATVAQSG